MLKIVAFQNYQLLLTDAGQCLFPCLVPEIFITLVLKLYV